MGVASRQAILMPTLLCFPTTTHVLRPFSAEEATEVMGQARQIITNREERRQAAELEAHHQAQEKEARRAAKAAKVALKAAMEAAERAAAAAQATHAEAESSDDEASSAPPAP